MIRNASYPQIRMQPGTLIAVIGYSRSGKSTFLGKLLSGVIGSRLYVPMDETATSVLARYYDADVAVRCGPTKNKWDGDLGHWTLEKNRYGKIGIKGKI